MIRKEGKGKEIKIKKDYVKWFSEIGKKDGWFAGGKGANLGEMARMKMPVPPGFVVTAQAYSYFVEKAGLNDKIKKILSEIDIENTAELEEKAKEIREIIVKAEIPDDLREEILEAYEILSVDRIALENATGDALAILKRSQEPIFVAVRSSATTEDLESASFAGQQETFLNIKGNFNLIEAIKKCFASLFTARAIYYRERKGFGNEKSLLAVIVQKMIDSDKSGVIFSDNPMGENDNVVIEAVFGLGEGIVSGKINPDYYEISRELKIIKKNIGNKKIAITRNSQGETEQVGLTADRSKSQVLSDSEIKRLADYSLQLEKHYNKPQDIEFAIEQREIYIVQTRAITTKFERKEKKIEGEIILTGLGASPGVASGEVRIIKNLDELGKIKKGDILVTKMTNPDMVVTMQKCNAIITDEGGLTAHASIVSREMGIPAVVGTGDATKKLHDGQFVTVDGTDGKIYSGLGEYRGEEKIESKKIEINPVVHTKTKIKVTVDLPNFATRAAETHADSVGLVRIEGIIALSGKHPNYFIKEGKKEEYVDLLFEGISKIAEPFNEIWIRTSDIRSDEYRNLLGASKEAEINPMLGMHGIRAGLKHQEILESEIRAIKKCSTKHSEKKFGIMLPLVISVEELREAKKIAENLGLDFEKVKFGVMIETPAACQIIDELCEEGISFISFGTNDLTQYTLAVDRGNEEVQYLYNEMNPAVLKQMENVIKVCKKYNVETSICGQAGSRKEMAEFLVRQGIDSISVNADAAHEISVFVKNLEKNIQEEVEIKEPEEFKENIEEGIKEIIQSETQQLAEIKEVTEIIQQPLEIKPELALQALDSLQIEQPIQTEQAQVAQAVETTSEKIAEAETSEKIAQEIKEAEDENIETEIFVPKDEESEEKTEAVEEIKEKPEEEKIEEKIEEIKEETKEPGAVQEMPETMPEIAPEFQENLEEELDIF